MQPCIIAAIRLRGEPIRPSPKLSSTVAESVALAKMVLREHNADDLQAGNPTTKLLAPPAIEAVVNSFVPQVTGEFRIVLDEPPPRVVPPLKIKIEYGEATTEAELRRLGEQIVDEMHSRVRIRPQINWVAPRTLERFLKKKKVFEKTYK